MKHKANPLAYMIDNPPISEKSGLPSIGARAYQAFWTGYEYPEKHVREVCVIDSLASKAFQAGRDLRRKVGDLYLADLQKAKRAAGGIR